jgi:hypothetical protein
VEGVANSNSPLSSPTSAGPKNNQDFEKSFKMAIIHFTFLFCSFKVSLFFNVISERKIENKNVHCNRQGSVCNATDVAAQVFLSNLLGAQTSNDLTATFGALTAV